MDTPFPALPPLRQGSRVALLAPSGPLPEGRLDKAVEAVRRFGLEPEIYPSARAHRGYLAGSDDRRAADVQAAFFDDRIEGILCLRGGYGAQRLYSRIDWKAVAQHPKPLYGYSDVTFFHAQLQNLGIRSFHTPMPSTEWYAGLDEYTEHWLRLALFGGEWGELPNCPGVPRQTIAPGRARGTLVGGNLSLLTSALGTPYAPDLRGKILFLEDVGEAPYRLDGMLQHLVASGCLEKCRGIALGYFTDCVPREGKQSLTIEEIFCDLLAPLGIPVLAGLTCGHSEPTLSLPLGAEAELDAGAQTLTILPD